LNDPEDNKEVDPKIIELATNFNIVSCANGYQSFVQKDTKIDNGFKNIIHEKENQKHNEKNKGDWNNNTIASICHHFLDANVMRYGTHFIYD